MEELELKNYLDNEKIECSTVLSKLNWGRLLNSDVRIIEILEEWKTFNLKIKINSMTHGGSMLRSPKEKGYTNYFFDGDSRMYKSYEMMITRSLSLCEIKKYGKYCLGISRSIDLPLSMCLTVIRADIQHKINTKNKCNCCCCCCCC